MDAIQDFEDFLELLDRHDVPIKECIDHPRHQEDARVLRLVLEQRRRRG